MAVREMSGHTKSPSNGCYSLRSRRNLIFFVFVIYLGCIPRHALAQRPESECYLSDGRPQRCIPEFVNAAFQRPVEATNTCGANNRIEYCLQTGHTGQPASCHWCDARDPTRSHPAAYLTDFNNNRNVTYWQSETIYQGVQHPNSVNLTLHLGKTFEVVYVRLKFYTSRPESFAIYKSMSTDGEWVPYQYYSSSCQRTYGEKLEEPVTEEEETKAICTDDFSDISPLTGGNVAFATLEGRPHAYHFDTSPVLQKWVSASVIRITLDRINTFGDEIFGDANVLKSYYYAVSDLSVGGRCKCNGHSSECRAVTGQNLEEELVCMCEHKTTGPDCERCLPFYNDQPWGRATVSDARQCQPCDCNGLSVTCYFDPDLHARTGHGGHCTDCRENTSGPHCELCRENFYRRPVDDRCSDCQCNPTGSRTLQCDDGGRCQCKPGVTGDKCDRCQPGFYEFGEGGCRSCDCTEAGSLDNSPTCDSRNGQCSCKEHVEGRTCDQCKPGYFNLESDNKFGCIPCFCYGHSSTCQSSDDYVARNIGADFNNGAQNWKAVDQEGNRVDIQWNAITQNIGVNAEKNEMVYFTAPSRFLGDRRASYNQILEFSLHIGEEGGSPTRYDVVLVGGDGQKVSVPVFAQRQQMPRTVGQKFKFKLSEHPDYQWSPYMNPISFMHLLSNLTELKIRGTYTPGGVGFLDAIKLGSARRGSSGDPARWVEQCTCTDSYLGQNCEDCAPGFRRDPPNGGPLDRCVPCQCNNHSETCDVQTGRCICQHHTEGNNCERCVSGYYGNPSMGTPNDCQVCPCPNQGPCIQVQDNQVACLNCPAGYGGLLCDVCTDGHYGDPEGKYGLPSDCMSCTCNDNIDPNAIGNCNGTTGECLKCIYDTTGRMCERCLPGFYGSALTNDKPGCHACNCYPPGTDANGDGEVQCDMDNGQCPCKENVGGRKCGECAVGYWNIDSGAGCEQCDCNPIGSVNETCSIRTGQCYCAAGVGGLKCDECLPLTYGFHENGCKDCACDPVGSESPQCDAHGQCPCKPGVTNAQCDQCMENKYDLRAGCIDCPPCYGLVQKRVDMHRGKLAEIEHLLETIDANPPNVSDQDFEKQLVEVQAAINRLLEDAEAAADKDGGLATTMDDLKMKIEEILKTAGKVTEKVEEADESSQVGGKDIKVAEDAIDRSEEAMKRAQKYIVEEGKKALEEAQAASDKFGQQSSRMSEIAREAREEAERQEQEAKEIEKLAADALNTSREAYAVANAAIQGQGKTTDEIEKLRNQYYDAEDLFDRTKQLAEDAREQATEVYDEVLETLTDANSLQLPTVDSDAYNTQATQISEEAERISDEAMSLMTDNEQLIEDISGQEEEARRLLREGERQQNIADEMLADVDRAKAKAEEAVAKGDETLTEARETLKTLQDFDKQVRESEGKAKEAMTQVPDIEQLIGDAENKTQAAQNLLADAEHDATEARDIARQAQTIAEGASDDAGNIREEAGTTKQRAGELKDESTTLADEVSTLDDLLTQLENQTGTNELLAKQALSKADQAKKKATASSIKVQTALDTVKQILDTLNNLDSVDEVRLNELERDLEEAEKRLKDANLEERVQELRVANEQQSQWVKDYSADLEQLRRDVDNIEDIRDALPDGCFRTEVLEPVG